MPPILKSSNPEFLLSKSKKPNLGRTSFLPLKRI
jgi:hypothetical protein